MHTLSFIILNDLKPALDRRDVIIKDLKLDTIEAGVLQVTQQWRQMPENDPSNYYFGRGCFHSHKNVFLLDNGCHDGPPYFDFINVAMELQEEGYSVWNRFEKYYVIAFAIDYKRFQVCSKGCDPKVMHWGKDVKDQQGAIDYQLDDQDINCNENRCILAQMRMNECK